MTTISTTEAKEMLESAAALANCLEGELEDKRSDRAVCKRLAAQLVDSLMHHISELDKREFTS